MMSEAGVEGYYTNHSLRATAVSRLFQNDVDDKLIKGVSGHRSHALQGYKRETEEQLLKVLKIVQGQCFYSTGTWGYYLRNNDLLLHLSDLNNDLLFHSTEHLDALLKIITCSKQWKGALN